MKWQPNEIDGLYYSESSGTATLFPIEAKALSTHDDVNLEQMTGAYITICNRFPTIHIVPLATQMIKEGIKIALLRPSDSLLQLERYIRVLLSPPITSWLHPRGRTPLRTH